MSNDSTTTKPGRTAAWQRNATAIDVVGDTLSIGQVAERTGYRASVISDQMRRADEVPAGTSRAVVLRPGYDCHGEPRWSADTPARYHRLRADEKRADDEARGGLEALTRDDARARGLASLRTLSTVLGVSLTTLSSRLRQLDGFPPRAAISHHSEGRRPHDLYSYRAVRAFLLALQESGRRGLKDLDLTATPEQLPASAGQDGQS